MPKIFRGHNIIGSIPQLASIPSTFNPATLAGIKLWLKADAITGLTDGQAVSSWIDSSGNGFNATQGNGSYQPIYKTNIKNGLPVVRFDGNDDFLATVNGAISDITNEITVFAITATSVRVNFTFVGVSDDGANRIGTHTPWTDGTLYWDFGNLNGGGRCSGAWGGTNGVFYQWTYLAGGNNMKVKKNKVELLNLGSSSSYNASGKTLQIGGTSGAFMQGDIAELIFYKRRLTIDEIALVENYLSTKYNI